MRSGQRGFSLIELLASAAILGVLASVAVPVVETTVRRQKERELRTALRDLRAAIDAYKQASAGGHIPVPKGHSGYPPDLASLMNGVPDEMDPKKRMLYFLRRIPRDPFHPDQAQKPLAMWGLRSSTSPSTAPLPGDDVFDIYSRSGQTGLNKVPYAEW
ncbi:type II secretion system protein [Pseudoduganella violacea]|uniref:General secretion pathway protein G n=1 Tax=Pseudoduganella violacea TaxID=1715466 RepID=A0A7W5FW56_9BURK|nr:type II secretion system protein [Pseudoduganella violacea]MBB3121522.1 general secretion pathway protein G [Pseudoduganella violacea]